MEKFLSKTMLFQGISAQEIHLMLNCLGAQRRQYAKGTVICRAGSPVHSMGLVLSGCVQIENNDPWGNTSVLGLVHSGQVFAETYAGIPDEPMLVDVIAAERSDILFLNMSRLLHTCPEACAHHGQLIRNLLAISAQKNLSLSRRIFHTSSKSIRGRLLSYLSFESVQQGTQEFDIPFSRQQLADYLSVDRSALSNELSKMQRDGLIVTNKNHFFLKTDALN